MIETAPLAALRVRLTDGRAAVGVAGLGYVGLPLAVELARAGFRVTGIDPDTERVRAIARGESPIEALPADAVAELVHAGRLEATSGWDVTPTLDAIVICVPTPLTANREPDLSFVRAAAAEVADRLRPGQLVVLESTTYPGTTEEVLLPLLESGGLRAGQDFALAYSPERVDPGNPHYHVANTPKLVGGVTPTCTTLAQALYEKAVIKVVPVSSPRVAETAKLLENVFRNVNIALVNELAMLCDRMGVDVWEVVEAAATKPFGFMRFQPGPGVGGHCIPVDPIYLAWKAKEYDFYSGFITRAAEVNANMPYFVAEKLSRILAQRGGDVRGRRVLLLGVSFKRNVGDIRNSSALKILELLEARGLEVSYHDSFVPRLRLGPRELTSVTLEPDVVSAADCVVIHTDHETVDYEWLVTHARLVFDTRNATRDVRVDRTKVVRL
ncbi:MAG TPA: nucleotide sugar dehydrogenase [Methylomirabilota bacterium]|jgi:UDP-N-acetyl-D-glucosamine dehydrogenase|nr:nucleotide sugar dehydrogenase [Methylomirabilota bacterium]